MHRIVPSRSLYRVELMPHVTPLRLPRKKKHLRLPLGFATAQFFLYILLDCGADSQIGSQPRNNNNFTSEYGCSIASVSTSLAKISDVRHVVERVVSKVCLIPQHNFPCDHDRHERGACASR